ncbi:hypothetical protein [Cupriavidus sp. RAF12]
MPWLLPPARLPTGIGSGARGLEFLFEEGRPAGQRIPLGLPEAVGCERA